MSNILPNDYLHTSDILDQMERLNEMADFRIELKLKAKTA